MSVLGLVEISGVILVSGATGNVGYHLVRELASRGAQVRALVRDPAKAGMLSMSGIEICRGDLEDPQSLDHAMNGVRRAFLLPANSMRQVKQEANFIDSAIRAKLDQVVKLSLIGADPKSPGPIPQWHGMAERRLSASGLKHTVLRPNFYMQNMFWFASRIRASADLRVPLRDAPAALVDVRDIAAVAAVALTEPGHDGKTYVLTGPAPLTFVKIAEELSRVAGHSVTYVDIPQAEFKQTIVRDWGIADTYADAVVSIWRTMGVGRYEAVTDDVQRITGRAPIGFDQFASDYATIFEAASPLLAATPTRSRRTAGRRENHPHAG